MTSSFSPTAASQEETPRATPAAAACPTRMLPPSVGSDAPTCAVAGIIGPDVRAAAGTTNRLPVTAVNASAGSRSASSYQGMHSLAGTSGLRDDALGGVV